MFEFLLCFCAQLSVPVKHQSGIALALMSEEERKRKRGGRKKERFTLLSRSLSNVSKKKLEAKKKK